MFAHRDPELWRAAFEKSSEPCVVSDSGTSNILFCNELFVEEFITHDAGAIVGSPVGYLAMKYDRDRVNTLLASLTSSTNTRHKLVADFERLDGSLFRAEVCRFAAHQQRTVMVLLVTAVGGYNTSRGWRFAETLDYIPGTRS